MKADIEYINPLCRNCEFKQFGGCGRINVYNHLEHENEYIYSYTIRIDGLGNPIRDIEIKWCNLWNPREVEYIERMKNERVY